jgi:phytoene desaturase
MAKAIIIGSGFGGLSTACLLAKDGYQVEIFEKNEQPGGRASQKEVNGYTFDMGPSWYLMPDVFEHFYQVLGENIQDHLELIKLSPSYKIWFKDTDHQPVEIYSDLEKTLPILEKLEPGCTPQVRDYLKRAEYQYEVAMQNFVYKNYDSITDFFNLQMAIEGAKLSVFTKMQKYTEKFFQTEELQKIMQYTLVFLGSSPYNTPALYNIMSHIDFNMGVFYPKGGFHAVAQSLLKIAQKHGANIQYNKPVQKIITKNGKATAIQLQDGSTHKADLIISNADVYHTETKLLDLKDQQYPQKYWNKKVPAPSAFIMYLGYDGKIPQLDHHNLIFSKDWQSNFSQIFDNPQLPEDPSIYICNPNKSQPEFAPEGKENLFVLVPIAAGLNLTDKDKQKYTTQILNMMSQELNIPDLAQRLEVKEIFTGDEFASRYNSFQGSALGLAHTLTQTALFRPRNYSKKVKNLYYTGGNTVPGIGVPMCLISSQLVYKRLKNDKSAGPMASL